MYSTNHRNYGRRHRFENRTTKQCCERMEQIFFSFVSHLWHSGGTLVANEINKTLSNLLGQKGSLGDRTVASPCRFLCLEWRFLVTGQLTLSSTSLRVLFSCRAPAGWCGALWRVITRRQLISDSEVWTALVYYVTMSQQPMTTAPPSARQLPVPPFYWVTAEHCPSLVSVDWINIFGRIALQDSRSLRLSPSLLLALNTCKQEIVTGGDVEENEEKIARWAQWLAAI